MGLIYPYIYPSLRTWEGSERGDFFPRNLKAHLRFAVLISKAYQSNCKGVNSLSCLCTHGHNAVVRRKNCYRSNAPGNNTNRWLTPEPAAWRHCSVAVVQKLTWHGMSHVDINLKSMYFAKFIYCNEGLFLPKLREHFDIILQLMCVEHSCNNHDFLVTKTYAT
jgi:hypothetical protein